MNKQEIYEYLTKNNINFECIEHESVYTMKEISKVEFPYTGYEAKNLFVRDDKKRNYYLISIELHKKLDLKEFKNKYNTGRLSFASPSDLMNIMNLIAGSVSPLGILNDKDLKVIFYLDNYFIDKEIIGIHPNDNTATIYIKVNDLINIIKKHGNEINIVEI